MQEIHNSFCTLLKCLIFAHVKVFQMVIDTGWDIIYVMWYSWMLSTHFKAHKTFQYQDSASDHFLAGGKRLKCLIFAHVKVFQLVIDTGWDIIYVIWYSWMFSTHFKANETFQYQERAWDHFLAGGKGLQCVIFSLYNVLQLIKETEFVLIYPT